MVRWSNFMEASRRKKSPKLRLGRKWLWKNASSKSHLCFRNEQYYSSANELVGSKRRDTRCDSDFESGVSPLIRDNLRLQKSNYFNNLSVFDRLGWGRKRGHCSEGILSRSGFKHGVSPLTRERSEWSEPNFQKKQRFNGRAKYRKGDNYQRVKPSKGNMFVKIGLALHETNEVFNDGLGLLEHNRFNNLSVFDRLGSDKRSYFAKGTARLGDSKSGVSPFIRDRLKSPKPGFQKKQPLHWKAKFRKGGNYRKGKHFNGNIFVKIDNNQDVHEIDVLDDVHEVDDNQFQPQTDVPALCDDINSEEASSNECEVDDYNQFQSRTVVRSICDVSSNECEIDNCNQFLPLTVVRNVCDDSSNECEVDNYNQFQSQTVVRSICDDISSNERKINNCNQFQPLTVVRNICDDSSNECEIGNDCNQFQPQAVVRSVCDDISSNERKIENWKQFQPRTDVDDMCDNFSTDEASINECEMDNDCQFQPQIEVSSNECVSDNLHEEALPDFVSDISPAGRFKFVGGVRSFQSERFCVELYPMDKLGSS